MDHRTYLPVEYFSMPLPISRKEDTAAMEDAVWSELMRLVGKSWIFRFGSDRSADGDTPRGRIARSVIRCDPYREQTSPVSAIQFAKIGLLCLRFTAQGSILPTMEVGQCFWPSERQIGA